MDKVQEVLGYTGSAMTRRYAKRKPRLREMAFQRSVSSGTEKSHLFLQNRTPFLRQHFKGTLKKNWFDGGKDMKTMDIRDIEIKESFDRLFPVEPETLNRIKEHMKIHGYDPSQPVTVWNRILVDGHTRLTAALEIGIEEIPVCSKQFADEQEALEYAIHNQVDRRNLTDGDILRLIEALDRRCKVGRPKITSNEVISGDTPKKSHLFDVPAKPGTIACALETLQMSKKKRSTSQRTAKIIGTSSGKVEKARAILDRSVLHLDNEKARQAVLRGDMSINKAYNKVMKKQNSCTLEFGRCGQTEIYLMIKGGKQVDNFLAERFLKRIDWMILGTGQTLDMSNFPEDSQLYFPKWKNAPVKDDSKKMTPEEYNEFLENLRKGIEEKKRVREIEFMRKQAMREIGQFSTA
jgi:hypothetical protein